MRAALIIALLAISFSACKKKSIGGKVPVVTFESMAPNKVQALGQDTVLINVLVKDGDGDLGNLPSSGNHDIYLLDTRINQANPYFFPEIPYDDVDAKNGITAHVTVKVIAALFLAKRTDPVHKDTDTVVYKIYVKDKAGNVSDTITAPPIYLF